jgi:hypothetical protein
MCSFVFWPLFVDFEPTGTKSTAVEEQEGRLRLGDPYSRARTHARSKRLWWEMVEGGGWSVVEFWGKHGSGVVRRIFAPTLFRFGILPILYVVVHTTSR